MVSPTLLRPESSSSFLIAFDANLAFRRGFSGSAKRKHITLAYNINDSINMLAQNGATTSFTYDAENRRLNETANATTTTRHYTNQSDNPTSTTQTVQGVTKTEHYTPTLGSSLNIITTTDGTTKTAAIQLQDLRGNTATTINLDTNIASSWCTFDEYGNQAVTNPQNTNLINYSTYAQAQRATNNTTGLILMGARIYNPTTNQFTSPDPVTGGNENPYAYPNDPINQFDFSGLMNFWVSLALGVALDMIFTAMGIVGSTSGFGLLILGAKSFLVTFLVEVVGMLVDGDFSKNRVSRLFETLVVNIIAGPFLSKFLPKAAIKSTIAKLAKWVNQAIDSALQGLGISRIEEEVHFIGDQIRQKNSPTPAKPVIPILKQG